MIFNMFMYNKDLTIQMKEWLPYEDISIQDAFEKIVYRYPDKIALIEGEKVLTYRQFNVKINQFVHCFQEHGVGKGKRVVIIAERCIDSVVAILALIKMGAIYIPLDPDFPRQRVEYVIDDCDAYAVCCFNDDVYTRKTIKLSDLNLTKESEQNPKNYTTLDDPAYITYTSGTTGVPKGVIIPQKAIVKLKLNAYYDLQFKESDIAVQFSSMASTASVSELFFTFLVGATLVLTTKNNVLNVKEYEDCCIRNRVNVLIVSPRYYMEINVPTVDRIITLGESINTGILNKIPVNAEYINLYGTSETGGAALCWHWDKEFSDYKKLPIGKSVKNVASYIVDNGKICEVGQVGELCIVTDGLTSGYLNLEKLTSKKICNNPFGSGKIYYTGDRVVLQDDGNVVYVGRVDDQVKINGFRVELSDVENTIKQEKQITSCAVIAKENASGECEIYAYIVSKTGVNIGEFRQRLLQKIPYYMVPSFIKQIDRIPLTHNGKLDRRSLLEIKERMENDITVTFLNEIEEKLYEIYKKLLNINYFNCETSFFELGGQSLKAIRLIAEIEKVFQCKLTAQIIFELPSVRQLADYIQQHTEETQEVEFTKAAEKQLYNVSSTQNRIYLICQGDSSKLLYNLPRCFVCKGIVDVNKVKKVFETIVERHEILRTSFILHQGKLYQRVNHNVKANFEYVEESNLSENELISEFVKPFDLAEKSLVRMKVIKRIEDYVMLIDMHHIISDGTSYNNFITEFNMLYADHPLKPLEYQYKDYSEWMQKRNLFQQRQYWINELGGGRYTNFKYSIGLYASKTQELSRKNVN